MGVVTDDALKEEDLMREAMAREPRWAPGGVPEAAYRDDVNFRHVVDLLEAMIHQAQLSPHEVRAAAMLAVIHYEMRRPLNIRVTRRDDGIYDIAEKP